MEGSRNIWGQRWIVAVRLRQVTPQRVVVLGAGFAGLEVATRLATATTAARAFTQAQLPLSRSSGGSCIRRRAGDPGPLLVRCSEEMAFDWSLYGRYEVQQ